jgi:DNA replication and repair protein RecF
MWSRIEQVSVQDFRSYAEASLRVEGRSVYLFGANGAGKTNFLEALSLLSPGRGLRGAPVPALGRRLPGEAEGRVWAVSALVSGPEGQSRAGVGVESPGAVRRLVRIDGQTRPAAALAAHVRPLWLTPAQDRLFLDGASDRRRFLDRLVFAGEPGHAAQVSTYERAQRERLRLLVQGPADPSWLSALEVQAARSGAAVALARVRAVAALSEEIAVRAGGPFPAARLRLTGAFETEAARGAPAEAIEASLLRDLQAGRARDASAGRALSGPHRGDLETIHAERDRPAAECSTGEQKTLILNLILAQAARLSRALSTPNPILLLDEVAAHLDKVRRAALFDEIESLSLQAFLTGTDEILFENLKGRALGVHVDASSLTILDS